MTFTIFVIKLNVLYNTGGGLVAFSIWLGREHTGRGLCCLQQSETGETSGNGMICEKEEKDEVDQKKVDEDAEMDIERRSN